MWRHNRVSFAGLDIEPNDPALAPYRDGLIVAKIRQGLYAIDEKGVTYPDGRLFRASLHFPATLPPGRYTVTVLQLREGRIIDAAVRPLIVNKVGLGAWISELARDNGLTGLSMGMSGDYPTAVTLGATHVRVGSALFGSRA